MSAFSQALLDYLNSGVILWLLMIDITAMLVKSNYTCKIADSRVVQMNRRVAFVTRLCAI